MSAFKTGYRALVSAFEPGFLRFMESGQTPVRKVTCKSIDTRRKLVKNGESSHFELFCAEDGGNVKNTRKMMILGASAFLGAGLLLTGCKSAPELTKADALAAIQAKYDQTPAVGANITVDDLGMRQGAAAKYWERTTIYPNKYWADFKLTAEGKKVIKLKDGSDVIKWRPESTEDKNFSVIVTTVAANHLKAKDLKDVEDETIPGVSKAKGVQFNESVSLEGVPDALQNIAHNPGNKLSTKRQADFALEDGAWKLHSIQ
jgi:hypothetical protein